MVLGTVAHGVRFHDTYMKNLFEKPFFRINGALSNDSLLLSLKKTILGLK